MRQQRIDSSLPKERRIRVRAPLAIFCTLALLFALALRLGDPSRLRPTLLGERVPAAELAALQALPEGVGSIGCCRSADLATGKVSIVNFWASWCAPCVQEHPLLVALKERTSVRLYGINYKDQAAAARRFLGRYGNPFAVVGVYGNGRAAIEWGVYGMPEPFIVSGKGEIVYKYVGPITVEGLEESIIPAIRAAQRGSLPSEFPIHVAWSAAYQAHAAHSAMI